MRLGRKRNDQRVRHRKAGRWGGILMLVLLLALLADYAFYPYGKVPSHPITSPTHNGLWIKYSYYFQPPQDLSPLIRRMKEQQIRHAYFHVRYIQPGGTLRYRLPEQARRLTQALRQDGDGIRSIAWIYAGNSRGRGNVDLSRLYVRRKMVEEAAWLVEECGFDGIQWDYEICSNGDPNFLKLLEETRSALPKGAMLSVATPLWTPAPFHEWGWSDAYFGAVAARCDQIVVMGYDSALYLPRMYAWLMKQQVIHATQAMAKSNPNGRVLIGVPTYNKGGWSHHSHSENLKIALVGVNRGLKDRRAVPLVFDGISLFADYTTQPEEWNLYRKLWLRDETDDL